MEGYNAELLFALGTGYGTIKFEFRWHTDSDHWLCAALAVQFETSPVGVPDAGRTVIESEVATNGK